MAHWLNKLNLNIIMFLIMICHCRARGGSGGGGGGGGRGGGGGAGGRGGSGSKGGSGSSEKCNAKCLAIIFGSIGGSCLGLFVTVCLCGKCRKQKHPCYLCCEMVNMEDWVKGTHRRRCMEENKETLDMMREQKDLDIKCGKCGGNLRMWSHFRKKQLDNNSNFICDVCHEGLTDGAAHKHIERKNENNNRFNCFLCDYDVCKECVVRSTKSGTRTQDPITHNHTKDGLTLIL